MNGSENGTARRNIARNLKWFRAQSGISQERLADLSGLHRTYVGAVERCERNISVDNIERLANALSVSIADLFRDETQ